jgi:hypothetical protein
MAFGESAFIIGASLTAINVVFIAITAVVARMLGLGVAKINILSGPTLFKLRVGATTIAVKPIPIGSGIVFRGEGDGVSGAEDADATNFRSIHEISVWERMLLALSAPIGFLLIAFALTGGAVFAHAATAFQQIYVGAIRPTDTGVDLLQQYVDAWRISPLAALGIISAKYGVYLLVPTAGSPGFVAIACLLKLTLGYETPKDFNLLAAIPLFVPPLIVLGGWALATFFFLYPLLDAAV